MHANPARAATNRSIPRRRGHRKSPKYPQSCRLHAVRVEKLFLLRRQASSTHRVLYPLVQVDSASDGRESLQHSALSRRGGDTDILRRRNSYAHPVFPRTDSRGPRLIERAKHVLSFPFPERSNFARAEVLHQRHRYITLTCGPLHVAHGQWPGACTVREMSERDVGCSRLA